ncbi:MAG: ABC transporter transmembrane domain-containing protein [Crocinitomicaceae bacterium]|nr:ABC transporter transmembrane domain-containing protein [Crocinitomicaceae bacterium]
MTGNNGIAKKITLMYFIRPYLGWYVFGWVFLFLSSSAGLIFPYLMGKLLGSTSASSIDSAESISLLSLDNATDVAFALFVLFAFQALFSFVRVVIFNNVTENTLRDIRNSAFKKMVYMPMSFFDVNKVGELTSRVSSDITQIQETLRTTIAEFFRQVIIILGGVAFLFMISWKLALIMLGTVPVMAVLAVFFGRFIRRLSKQAQDYAAESNSIIEETLAGISNVKAFTFEKFAIGNYDQKTQEIRNLNVKSGIWRGLFVSFIIFCLFGAIVFIVWQGLLMTQGVNPELSNEGFYQFVLFTIMMGASVGSLPDLYANIQKTMGAIENLMEILNDREEAQAKSGMRVDGIDGSIQFKDVNFRYAQRDDVQVLKNVSFSIEKNDKIALVGSSGSGKTTIASLMLNFYNVTEGEILMSGTAIDNYDLNYLRSNMAYVPQDVLLFSGSIFENIHFGNPNAAEEEVIEAAKKANAWEFITSFPSGMETEVGDRGIQLSGGQKQRIAIARAILKNPIILILDEATSALDSVSEKLVQEALDVLMKDRTSIVIAHRLSTIKKADMILVLENGVVSESGKHKDLMSNNGVYAKLVEMQQLDT